jgi:hypothetical protein
MRRLQSGSVHGYTAYLLLILILLLSTIIWQFE